MTAAGLVDVAAEGWLPTVRGGSALARYHRLSIDVMAGPLEAAGLWSRADIDAVQRRLADPGFLDVGLGLVSCSGRRPH